MKCNRNSYGIIIHYLITLVEVVVEDVIDFTMVGKSSSKRKSDEKMLSTF